MWDFIQETSSLEVLMQGLSLNHCCSLESQSLKPNPKAKGVSV